MKFIATIRKWGHSKGIVIPNNISKNLNLDFEDTIEVDIKKLLKDNNIPIRCIKCKEIMIINPLDMVADCPNCGLEITQGDFDYVYD